MMRTIAAILILAAVLTGCVKNTAGSYGCDAEAVCAGVSRDGRAVLRSTYGDNISRNSVFGIGSISKSFVALLALMLEQDGRISLDDKAPIDYWNKNITLKDLLSMKSGLADYTAHFGFNDYFKEYSRDELIRLGLESSALGVQGDFEYSNTNILIAVKMIEDATGKRAEDLISERFLKPLKMAGTFFAEDKENIHDLVRGYSKTSGGILDCADTTSSWATLACGMFSTVDDMEKWGHYILSLPELNPEMNRKLQDFTQVDENTQYGLCIEQKKIGDEKVLVLAGNVPGYSSALYMHDDSCISALCNLSDYSDSNIHYAEDIADMLLD
jgi:D-alanyl-D-alanine carboxypeptidase